MLLRGSWVLFWVVFSAHLWSDADGAVITTILLAIIGFQGIVIYLLRPEARGEDDRNGICRR
jgi:hypothetical protein